MRLTTEMSSHLNAILDRLIENGETAGLDEALGRSQRLLGMIDKVIDSTQVEAGPRVVADQPCDLREVFAGLAERHTPAAEAKGLTFHQDVDAAVPRTVRADRHRLVQILDYLIENAIQYTEDGFVSLRLTREPTGSWDTVRLRFEIEDTGCGIDGELSGQVFEPFSSSPTGSFMEGSGLGLTVATRVARLMGGDVSFVSATGSGTTFTLQLEVRTAQD